MDAHFGILGPLDVEVSGRPVVVRGAKRRALLIRLLASANQRLPTDLLVDDVWDGAFGSGATSTLASHVSLLRGLIGADRIVGFAGTYCLYVEPGELDVTEFESATMAGKQAMGRSDFDAAALAFERALGHWRGQALADANGAAWALGERARLSELRCAVEELRIDARMALGQHRDVVGSAEAAVEAAPLREHRWLTLMLALYRCGRRADALRAFQRMRALLAEELGLEPSNELFEMERAVLQDAPELTPPELGREVPALATDVAPATAPAPAPATAPAPAPAPAATLTVVQIDWAWTAGPVDVDDEGCEGPGQWHFEWLRRALSRHDGREVGRARSGLLASFPSSSAALMTAAALQREVADLPRPGSDQLALCIGVSVGEIDVGDGEFYGYPVVEAGLLSELAQPGQILLSPLARLMAGPRCALRFADYGEHTLRGVPQPVAIQSLEWDHPDP
jgi:DNA-binding SARP family transcriptional activator